MSKDKKFKKAVKEDKKVDKKVTKADKKAEKSDKKEKKAKKVEVPVVLRADSMVDVMHENIDLDKEASDKVKGLPKKDLRYILDMHNATIFGHIANGGKVQFMPFITYAATVRLPRKGRNPKTGDPIDIPGSLGFSARAGKQLKELLNSNKELVKKLIAEKAKMKAEREAKKEASAKSSKSDKKSKLSKKSA